MKDPKERPTATTVCTTLSHLLETISIVRPPPNASRFRPSTPPPNLTLRGHTDAVLCAAFSVDGKHIVSGSIDGTIRVWNAQTGNPVLGPLKMRVGCVAFSPNGRRIASGSRDMTVLVWDAVTERWLLDHSKGTPI